MSSSVYLPVTSLTQSVLHPRREGRHLLEKEPISKLCDELGLQPTVFYRWHKEFFENGAAPFQAEGRADQQAEQERILYLESKAELMG